MEHERRWGLTLVFVAGVLYSTAGLFTRALHYDAWTILAWRAVFGVLFLGTWLTILRGRDVWRAFLFTRWQWATMPLIAVGGICFIFALKLTTVANVMVIYATMPFVTSAVAWLWGREAPSARMMIASAGAMLGVATMMAGGFGESGRLPGIGLTFLMNIAFAVTLVMSRRQPGSGTAHFTVGTLVNAVIAFALAPGEPVDPVGLATLALFGFVTIGLAMTLYMRGARLIPPAEVGLVGITDVVIGPLLVWAVFGERPGLAAALGGAIVIGALLWHLWPDLRRQVRSRPVPVRRREVR